MGFRGAVAMSYIFQFIGHRLWLSTGHVADAQQCTIMTTVGVGHKEEVLGVSATGRWVHSS